MSKASSVPCDSCQLCCWGPIMLYPGEETALPTTKYEGAGGASLRLLSKTNGECAHLGPEGCTVYEQRPRICRTFDCRDHYYLPAAERRRREALLVSQRDKAIIARGRALAEASR